MNCEPSLWQSIKARELTIGDIKVEIFKRTEPAVQKAPKFLPAWLRLRADAVNVGAARVVLTNGRVLDARPISTQATMTSKTLTLEEASLESGPYKVGGTLQISATDPVGLEGDVAWLVRLPDQPQYAGRVKFDGDLDTLQIDAAVSQPFLVAVRGTARSLTGELSWQADTRTDAFDLTPWQKDSKLGKFAAALKGAGTKERLAVGGTVIPTSLPTGPLEISIEGGFAGRQLKADSFVIRLTNSRGELQGQGTIDFDGGPPTLNLKGRWSDLGWPLEHPTVQSGAGEFTLTGPLPYDFTVAGNFAAPRGITGRMNATGAFDKTTLTARAFAAQTLQGEIKGSGSVSWAGERPWQTRLTARGLDPQIIHEAFDGRVNFDLSGSGRGFDAKGAWRIDLASLRGTVRSQTLTGKASVQREGSTFRVRDTNLQFGSTQIIAHGTYGNVHDLHFELDAPDLSKVLPEARGAVQLRGDLQGSKDSPQLASTLTARALEYRQGERKFAVEQLQVNADVDLSDREASWIRATANNLSMDQRTVTELRVTLDGRASAHDLAVRVDAGGGTSFELMTSAGWVKQEWSGELKRLAINVAEERIALAKPTRFTAAKTHASIEPFCLVENERRACGEGQWQLNGPWNVKADASGIPLRLLAAGLPRPAAYSGVLSLNAQAGAAAGQLWTGNARVDFADGVFRYTRGSGKVEDVTIGTGKAIAEATAQAFTVSADLKAADTASMQANARAERLPNAPWQDYPLSGKANARTTELGFVPIVLPDIDRASGELTANLILGGTLGAPRFEGSLVLDRGEMDLYTVNLLLRDLGLNLKFTGTSLELNGKARAGEGTATAEGKLDWLEGKPRGTLKLVGENLLLVDVPEARVNASPNLRFKIDGRRIDVDGAVKVPHARLAPANLTGAALPSEDEIIVGERQIPEDKRFIVTTGIHMVLGDDVHIESYGLSGRLTGGVLGYSATGEVSTGIGEIGIEDGKYVLYTRELDIERGRLLFSGGPLGDPGVDLRAVKQQPELLVGVNVRGTLRAPRLSFFSEPPLTQNQIASILVTGRTLDSIQDEGNTDVSQTREQLLAQGGALIAGRLGEQLGLENLTVGTDSENPASLVLGTYLSPRLYVSYGISLTESINTFKLRYTLGDRWTIKTEAGENTSADLVYTIER